MRFDGTTHPRKAVELKIGYLSAVDMPAHEGAQVTILKARITTKETTQVDGQTLLKSVFSAALAERKLSQQIESMFDQQYPLRGALREAAEEIAKDDTITDKQAALRGAVDEYINTLHLAMVGELVSKSSDKPKDDPKEADMADEQTQAELAKYKALSELSDVQKAHYATLSEAEQVEFLKGKREVPADESFTDVDGAVVSKSAVGSAAYQVMKAQNARLAKMQDDLDMQTLTKRAETELKHLPGDVVAKSRVLKAIDKMPEAERATIDQILKAADAAAAPGFKPAAVAGEESNDPEDKLEKMAKQHAADNKVSYSAAYAAVLATDEGKAIYKEMQ